MSDSHPDATDQTRSRDPSQITLPHVDTGIELVGPLEADDLILFAPSVAAILGAFAALLMDAPLIFWTALPVGLLLAVGAAAVHVSTRWYTSATERARNWAAYARARHSLPWGSEESIHHDVHGVERIHEDGTVRMTDGRYVGFVRVAPTNTSLQTDAEANRLVAQLSSAVDEVCKDIDLRIYTTTSAPDRDAVLGPYRERARDGALSEARRQHLQDIVDWYEHVDGPGWGARDWHHYVIVEASAAALGGEAGLWEMVNPLGDGDEYATDAEIVQELDDRRSRVTDAVSGVPGLSAARATREDVVDTLLDHWTGTDHYLSDALRDRLGDDAPAGEAVTPAQRALAPGSFDADRGVVDLGEQVATTFWLSEWPTQPDAVFLRDLYTLTGVDVDVTIRARSKSKRETIAELEHDIADVDSEGMEREAASDVTAADIDDDLTAFMEMRDLLRETAAQPWSVTAYVTVRASDRDALADARDTVRQALESEPANIFPIAPGTRQREAFQSASPVGRDAYVDTASAPDPKTTRCLGGAIGAAFPFCATKVEETGGLDWGRNLANGAPIVADPLERGAAPHLITIGQSRSGKTFGSSKAALRWYQADPDRSLIVCDTQGGFEGLTEFLDGDHHVVDGQQPLNPLHIEAVPEEVQAAAGGNLDPLGQQIDVLTQFVDGIATLAGCEHDHTGLIRAALAETYARAGITRHDLDSHSRESPTLADLVDVLGDIRETPAEYTFTASEGEMTNKREAVDDLLNHLVGLQEHGRYEHLLAEDADRGLLDTDADMAYLDLQHLQDSSDAEKSVLLRLMLSQVSQLVKQSSGPTAFLIDEAHVLLHSDDMITWLQKAAREWARYDAILWFVSQHPSEFVSTDADADDAKDTILGQCSTIQFYRTPRVGEDILVDGFGLNAVQADVVQTDLTPGKAGLGYSECLLHFDDHRGWFPTYVEATDREAAIFEYAAREHGDFESYLADRLAGSIEVSES